MLPEEFEQLCESIRTDGFDATYPIVLHQGLILDGRHRYQAAIAVGVEPVFVEWQNQGNDTPEKFAYRSNIRRHLTVTQRAAYTLAMTGETATIAEMAEAANVSQSTISKVRKLAREKPEIVSSLIDGEVTLEDAIHDRVDDENMIELPEENSFLKRPEDMDSVTYAMHMRHEFKALVQTMTELGKRLDELAQTEVGYALKVTQIKIDMKNAKDGIKWAMPYKNCPYPSHEGCKACRGLGWVIRDVWDNIPEEIKK